MTVRGLMLGRIVAWSAIVFAGYLPAANPQSPPLVAPAASTNRALLDRYCVTCHNQGSATAGLMLDKANLEKVGEDAAIWEKVLHKLRTGAMPPVGRPRPDAAGYNSVITYLETELDRASARNPNPGRPAIHRLNRAEYTNAIRDL